MNGVDGWVEGWVEGYQDEWMDGGWIDGRMYVLVRWLDGYMDV
jgi:hypothetical protein